METHTPGKPVQTNFPQQEPAPKHDSFAILHPVGADVFVESVTKAGSRLSRRSGPTEKTVSAMAATLRKPSA